MRKQSLNKIKEAIKNKTLTCYKVTSFHIFPYYYNKNYNTKCVIGCLVDDNEMKQYEGKDGHVSHLWNISILKSDKIDDLMKEKGIKEFAGFNINELSTMQKLHDNILEVRHPEVNAKEEIIKFENYINSL